MQNNIICRSQKARIISLFASVFARQTLFQFSDE